MPVPTDRENKVLVNKYYPRGLHEGDIYDHYMKYKRKIIDFCDNRPVILFNYFNNVNSKETVIRLKNGRPIKLNNKNYDSIISGHTLSISVLTSENGQTTNEIVIDVDPGNVKNENELKEAVKGVVSMSLSNKFMVTNSANGYHVRFFLNKPESLSKTTNELIDEMTLKFQDKYDINKKGPSSKIKLDLTPMYKNQGATVPYALTRKNGLMCLDITNKIDRYKRQDSVIKT